MQLSTLDQEMLVLLREYAAPALLGMARITACYAWLPYLSAGTLVSKLSRAVIALVTVVGLWPVLGSAAPPTDLVGTALAAAMEAAIGMAIGLTVSLPFHIFHAVGVIIDNQRGASISSTLDPISGIEATETGNLLQQFSVVVFLMGGGLVAMLEVIQASYQLLPMGARLLPSIDALHAFMGTLLSAAVRMALPVMLLLLLVEILLGVLSRFAQQMNAFSVSLAVKSFIAFLAMLLYLIPLLVEGVPQLWDAQDGLQLLRPTAP